VGRPGQLEAGRGIRNPQLTVRVRPGAPTSGEVAEPDLMRPSVIRVYPHGYRGFESHPLHSFTLYERIVLEASILDGY
jgi:hypothetical protein